MIGYLTQTESNGACETVMSKQSLFARSR
jgi:hypothetical protein